jgi:hypothetical protein
LAYANLLQSEKERGKNTIQNKKKQKTKKTHESNKDWVPWG